MRRCADFVIAIGLCSACLLAGSSPALVRARQLAPGRNVVPRAYLPVVIHRSCPTTSSNLYDIIPIQDGYYKNNQITDENPDFRLSILGYAPVHDEPLDLVDYSGGSDPNAPRFHGMFRPQRRPRFTAAYLNYQWNWDDGPGSAPPYGSRGPLNDDPLFRVTVLDFEVTPGEVIHIPERSVPIYGGNVVAMVLYASENELTITYTRHDAVYLPGGIYVVHLLNFCVDPQLVAAYRAQLNGGKRSTGKLPAIRNDQPVGMAHGNSLTVAIRNTARFMDPRSRKDWWQGIP
jgi:hypothetical protein